MALKKKITSAADMLTSAEKVAVLTGAGISAESGVPTFRGPGGMWEDAKIEDVATPQGFSKNPRMVIAWYHKRVRRMKDVRPNPGHEALAEIERRIVARGGEFALATQNIDALHYSAGSKNVLELHGSLARWHCTGCGHRIEFDPDNVPEEPIYQCPRCGRYIRPDVVWFGEALPQDVISAAADAARNCDVFISAGTSAVVYPAAGLVEIAVSSGARTIEVNLDPTPFTNSVDVAISGKTGEILPQIIAQMPEE